jgi:PAS domain S-box-containing protein
MKWAVVRATMLRKVAGLSLLCVIIITATFCATATALLNRYVIRHDAQMIGGLASEVATHLLPPAYWTEPGDPAVYADTFGELARSSGMVRLVLYDRRGRVLWSDDGELIGDTFSHVELRRALLGSISAKITKPGSELLHHKELGEFTRLEEIYVPVRRQGETDVIGVLEIYRHPAGLLSLLDTSLELIWVLGGGAGLLLYVAIYVIVRSASRHQMSLERELTAYARTLEERVSERTRELSEKTAEAGQLYQQANSTKEYLENLIESSADAIATIDRRGRISFVSRVGQQMFGCETDGLVGTPVRAYWARGIADLRAFRATLAEKQRVVGYETELRTPAGATLAVSLSAAVVNDTHGMPAFVVAVVRDVTELRELQEQVDRAERLKAASLLAAGVAQGVGNPLGCISFLAGVLRGRTSDPTVRQGLDDISQHATNIDRVIRELTTLVRPAPVQRITASLPALLEAAVRVAQQNPAVRRTRITVVLPPGLPAIMAAEDRLIQAFSNFITNAAEAGGDLTVTAVGSAEESRITFADTGHGIPSDELRRVFDPFYSSRDPGTHAGLGLFVSHEIVRQHGGRILVESRPGAGSRFIVVLPAANVGVECIA